MNCAVAAGSLSGHEEVHHGHVAEATLYAVVGDVWVPVCEEHAVGFAETQDHCPRSLYLRLARLDEIAAVAPRVRVEAPEAVPLVEVAAPLSPKALEPIQPVAAPDLKRLWEEGY